MTNINIHNTEIHENLRYWQQKPILQKIYNQFYQVIGKQINTTIDGKIVELGSGIGNLKSIVPQCVCTDLFPNPWIDQTENAYRLSFADNSVSNLILFDVWHHLEYPVAALNEFYRVLTNKGRVIIFEPSISMLGWLVYGAFHHEPVAWFEEIKTNLLLQEEIEKLGYYAAQGNASRFFFKKKYKKHLQNWNILNTKKFASFSYVASGGYRGKQLYPDNMYNFVKQLDTILDFLPILFSTRLLVVIEKR